MTQKVKSKHLWNKKKINNPFYTDSFLALIWTFCFIYIVVFSSLPQFDADDVSVWSEQLSEGRSVDHNRLGSESVIF